MCARWEPGSCSDFASSVSMCVCVFFFRWDRNIRVTRVEFVHMCSVKLVRVVCLLTSGWGSTLISSHSERCGAEGAKGDHTHWLGSVGHQLESLIGSVLGIAAFLRLLHCSVQSMIAIIRTVVRSSPIDAMRSSHIILCPSMTVVVVLGLKWNFHQFFSGPAVGKRCSSFLCFVAVLPWSGFLAVSVDRGSRDKWIDSPPLVCCDQLKFLNQYLLGRFWKPGSVIVRNDSCSWKWPSWR